MKIEQNDFTTRGSEPITMSAFAFEWIESVPALGSVAWLAPKLASVAEQVFGIPQREEETC